MYTTRGRYWISLLTAGALLMTLALAGCQRKDPDASGDDINWNVGSSASVPGDVSGDTASGGEPSGDASGDTTSGDAHPERRAAGEFQRFRRRHHQRTDAERGFEQNADARRGQN